MTAIRRRRILANLLASPLSLSSFGLSVNDAWVRRKAFIQDDRDLSAGCVLAWESPNCCDGLIDFWTARASDIDTTMFSSCVQRVVLWDDVFLLRSIRKSVDEIKAVIPKYFGFDCGVEPNGFAFHADGMNTFDQALAQVFEAKAHNPNRARTALVDLDSVGVTALDWPQILPSLRGQYDRVVGIAHVSHLYTSQEKLRPIGSGNSYVYESTWGNMQKCDLSIVYSDTLLNDRSELNLEKMGISLRDLISSLAFALNNQRLIRRLPKRNASGRAIPCMFGISGFATRLADEGHFNEVSSRQEVLEKLFGPLSEEQSVLMLDTADENETIGTVSLWPIAMKLN
jgi:hypothetical protein